MKIRLIKISLLFSLLVGMNAKGQAQLGKITGVVTDLTGGEPIIGCSVHLVETNGYATTNLAGEFEFNGIKAGTYTLRVSSIGYQTSTLVTEVHEQSSVKLEIAIQPESKQIEAVIITGSTNKRSESSLLEERKNATLVVQKMGLQELDRKGIGSVGEGLSKVSGVSVGENKALFVRGLGDRYNNATLNGLPIPSTNPDVKVIPLDIFPTSVVENIAVVKSYSPEFYGDFSGGTVDIVTQSFPANAFLKMSLSSGYNSSTTGKYFLQSPNANRGFLGFDKQKRSLPTQIAKASVYNSYENGNRDPFKVNWSPQATTAPLGRGLSLSMGNRYDLKEGRRVGVLFNLSHKGGFATQDGVSALYNAQQSARYRYDTESFSFKTNTSGLASVSYGPNERAQYTLTALAVNQSNDEVSSNAGEQSDLGRLLGQRNTLTQNSLLAMQFSSRLHPTAYRKVNWAVGYAKTIGSIPDRVQNTFQLNEANQYTFLTNSISDNHRFFAKLKDQEVSGKLEITLLPKRELGGLKRVHAGVDGRYKERRFDSRQFDAEIGIREAVDPMNVGASLTEERLGDGSTSGQWYYKEGYYGPNSYQADLGILAPFVNTSWSWNEKWSLLAGLRVEASVQNTDYKRGSDASDLPYRRNTLEGVDLLPAITLKYARSEKSNVLFAASRTISRPFFTEIAPFRYNNAAATAEQQGNPSLINTSNYNADLKVEWYPSRGELMAITLFGKYLVNPIERMQVASSDALFSFINTDQAILAGVELEFTRNLGSLFQKEASVLRNMSVGLNGTLMHSSIKLSERRIEENRTIGVPVAPTNRKRALYGASPYLVNLDCSYQANWGEQMNTVFTVSYNVFGKRLFTAGSEQAGDVYELPVNTLNLVVNSKINKQIGLDFTFSNLLNSTARFEQEFKQENLEFSRYKLGISVGAALSYSF